jgi:hypothetical protein
MKIHMVTFSAARVPGQPGRWALRLGEGKVLMYEKNVPEG